MGVFPVATPPVAVGVGVVEPRAESMLFSREWDGGWKKDLGSLRILRGMDRIFFSPGFRTLSNSACRLSSESCSMRIIVVPPLARGISEVLVTEAGDMGLMGPWLLFVDILLSILVPPQTDDDDVDDDDDDV